MRTTLQGRGGRTPAALGLLVAALLGLVMVVGALVGQVPSPASPDARGTSVTGGSHHASSRAPQGDDGQVAVTAESAGAAQGVAPAPTAAPDPGEAAAPTTDAATPGSDQDEEPVDGAEVLPRAEPLSVRVPAIDVESPLHALGLDPDGALEVPTGALVDEAAWYSGSPTPGQLGPSVIEGHVTGPGGRPSVFFRLGELEPGDVVEVDRADGSTVEFEVYDVSRYPKSAFPTVQVYGNTGGPELRLITCGGDFDTASGHHVDNTVVYARIVDDA